MGGSQWPFYRLPNAKRGLSRPSACIRIVLPSQQGTCTAYFILRRKLFSNYFSSHLTKAARIGAPPIAPHSHLSFSRPLSSTLNTRTIFLFLFFLQLSTFTSQHIDLSFLLAISLSRSLTAYIERTVPSMYAITVYRVI
jgi:hypothetical protein